MLDTIAHAVTILDGPDTRPFTVIKFDTVKLHDAAECHRLSDEAGNGTPTYITRFGDECCQNCNVTVAWSPHWVRDGIYGLGTCDPTVVTDCNGRCEDEDHGTQQWIDTVLDCFISRFIRTEVTAS